MVSILLLCIGMSVVLVLAIYDDTLNKKRAINLIRREIKRNQNGRLSRLEVSKSGDSYMVTLKNPNSVLYHLRAAYNKKTNEMKWVILSDKMEKLSLHNQEVEDVIADWLLHAKEVAIPLYKAKVFKKEKEAKGLREKQKDRFLRFVNQHPKTKD